MRAFRVRLPSRGGLASNARLIGSGSGLVACGVGLGFGLDNLLSGRTNRSPRVQRRRDCRAERRRKIKN